MFRPYTLSYDNRNNNRFWLINSNDCMQKTLHHYVGNILKRFYDCNYACGENALLIIEIIRTLIIITRALESYGFEIPRGNIGQTAMIQNIRTFFTQQGLFINIFLRRLHENKLQVYLFLTIDSTCSSSNFITICKTFSFDIGQFTRMARKVQRGLINFVEVFTVF